MKVGENPLYTMTARYLELATEVVLEPTSHFKDIYNITKGKIGSCFDCCV
jgi:hypothetical protein